MLTEKQNQFVAEYVIDFNGTKAAIRAGYGEAGAGTEAFRLLMNAEIRSKVDEALEAKGERAQLTADRIVWELMKIAFADIKMVAEWDNNRLIFKDSHELNDFTSGAIAEISEKTVESPKGSTTQIKVKMHDKLKAIEMLARHVGLFKSDDPDAEYRNKSTAELLILVQAGLQAGALKLEGK